ncbi:MAG: ABC transporter substrate-binding protein, partial [Candidatus Hodarchaeales archaeon]
MKHKFNLTVSLLLIFCIITIFIVSSSVTTPNSTENTSGELKNQNKFIWETSGCPKYIDPIDPATNYESNGNKIIDLIYESLIGYKGNSVEEIEGKLATSWTISSDGLKYIFTLREDVTFHDGVVFNAYIMKYSIDRTIIMSDPYGPSWMLAQVIRGGATYMSYKNPNVTEALAYLDAGGVVVLNDFTLMIILDLAYAPFIHSLAYTVASAVSPKAVIENEPSIYNTNEKDYDFGMVPLIKWFDDLNDFTKLGLTGNSNPRNSGVVPGSSPRGTAGHDWMGENAVGTGPYVLKSLNENIVLLKKNTNWWGSFTSHAVDFIEIKTVSDDETRIQDLRSGDADMICVGPLDASKVIKTTGEPIFEGVNSYTTPVFQNYILGMNMRESLPCEFLSESADSTFNASENRRYASGYELASHDNPFTALLFRKAIVTAFDYTTYINQALTGISERMEGIIPENMFSHHNLLIENGNLPTYNLEAARTLFKMVGWKGTIKIAYNADSDLSALAFQLLAKSIVLCDVGIEILLQPMDPVSYTNASMSM